MYIYSFKIRIRKRTRKKREFKKSIIKLGKHKGLNQKRGKNERRIFNIVIHICKVSFSQIDRQIHTYLDRQFAKYLPSLIFANSLFTSFRLYHPHPPFPSLTNPSLLSCVVLLQNIGKCVQICVSVCVTIFAHVFAHTRVYTHTYVNSLTSCASILQNLQCLAMLNYKKT